MAGVAVNQKNGSIIKLCLGSASATFRLIYGRVPVYTLKENMGTSVEMIERHYGHLTPTLAAAELTQRTKLV